MTDASNKRNYIRRKKYLMESVNQIKATLEFIRIARGDLPSEDIQKQALAHAQAVEAVCWSPRARLSAETYQRLMASKTQEFCRAILKRAVPGIDFGQLQRLTVLRPESAPPMLPEPILPIPIIRRPAPGDQISETDWAQPVLSFVSTFDEFNVRDEGDRMARLAIDRDLGMPGTFNRYEPNLNEADGAFAWSTI
jgi:hypothetical protein